MKRYSAVVVGVLTLMLMVSGLAYAQAQEQAQQQSMDMVNVNLASEQDLQQVPGLDQTMAQSIIQHRQTSGPFSSVDDLTQVEGIDEQKLQGMRGWLTAEKLNINVAKAEHFQQLPGMDQAVAQNIIRYRDTNGPFQSVNDLTKVQGIDDKKLDSIEPYLTANKINLNTATAEDLQIIPSVDQSLAQSIIDYRQANGPFQSVDDLSQVQGIDKQLIESMEQYVTAEKINLNTATAQEMQVLPGMDQSLAQNIVQYRQTNGPFSSVDDLSQVSGITEEHLNSLRDHVTVEEQGGGGGLF